MAADFAKLPGMLRRSEAAPAPGNSNKSDQSSRLAGGGRGLLVIFVVLFELGFFFAEQLLDHPALLKISGDLEHCPVVLDVLPNDKTFHDPLPGTQAPAWPLS